MLQMKGWKGKGMEQEMDEVGWMFDRKTEWIWIYVIFKDTCGVRGSVTWVRVELLQ